MWLVLLLLGMVACSIAGAIVMPASRDLTIKLGTLVSWTQRQNPTAFQAKIAPTNPFVGSTFVHKRITGVLRADMTEFGAACQQLQREAKQLDRRAHIGMLPIAAYLAGVAIWWLLLR